MPSWARVKARTSAVTARSHGSSSTARAAVSALRRWPRDRARYRSVAVALTAKRWARSGGRPLARPWANVRNASARASSPASSRIPASASASSACRATTSAGIRSTRSRSAAPSPRARRLSQCRPSTSAASSQSSPSSAWRRAGSTSSRSPYQRPARAWSSGRSRGMRCLSSTRNSSRRSGWYANHRPWSSSGVTSTPSAHELLEAGLTAVGLGDRVGERAVQLLHDRGAEQEVERLGRLTGDHLAHQVVAHGAIVAGEASDEAAGVGVVVKRQRREPETRRPALGALPEQLQVVVAYGQVQCAEQLPGLARR